MEGQMMNFVVTLSNGYELVMTKVAPNCVEFRVIDKNKNEQVAVATEAAVACRKAFGMLAG